MSKGAQAPFLFAPRLTLSTLFHVSRLWFTPGAQAAAPACFPPRQISASEVLRITLFPVHVSGESVSEPFYISAFVFSLEC